MPYGHIHDILGIGFGPANLALAIALEESAPGLSARFIEARDQPRWQPGMLLDGSDIQNHPSRDLVTLRNPRSRYSFLNYLFEQDRLIAHLNLPMEFPLRKEYAQYISWAADQFGDVVDCGRRAVGIEVQERDGERLYVVDTDTGERYVARSLVVAPGRTPLIPAPFDGSDSRRVFHLTDYLFRLKELAADRDPEAVAVIGGSQSAVELTLDLARRFPRTRVVTYVRSHSLRLKDTSPFSEEGYFPEFTEYYYQLSREGKRSLDAYMKPTNYSSADGDVLRELYLMLYEQRLDQDQRVFVKGNRRTDTVREVAGGIELGLTEVHTGAVETDTVDFAVLATGFRNLGPGPDEEPHPPLLAGLADRLAREPDGRLDVRADYSLTPLDGDGALPPLFLNGLCESSHGIGDAGSFSLLSLRASVIADALRKGLGDGAGSAPPERPVTVGAAG
ncbi:lysine N(6)-hydroxylase/L-ornithine N(5)-oxygenase family protein [Streptomyces sp. SAJ15]|uniref:lysine N(6)-hydroxylase/L-ornithine N(5)-oxygenase family protein n=1 Tax=Streptomyces sp. SAJ15 TaxID=2011095 RepID=UPI001185E4D3|nr:SidA/IucD/PvdA family monooxygenase [Streptomyces sp. SAJ15]TVL93000.1 ornithine monooxygenase [Streptomyces sp. SAJ15]